MTDNLGQIDTADTILYLDPFSGVSGDMFLGALISLGVPEDVIINAVEGTIPGEVCFDIKKVTRAGLAGVHCDVIPEGGPGRRSIPH